MNAKALDSILELINAWWNTDNIPEEKLQAYVASIYKKGDTLKPDNYRPISLLNSIYKIYAGMIQTRLAKAMDSDIAQTQFGRFITWKYRIKLKR